MDKLIDFYDRNKTIVFLVVAIIIVGIIGSLILINDNNQVIVDNRHSVVSKIYLFGNSEITIYQNDKYIEPGYYAVSIDGELLTDKVVVTPDNLDTSVPGTYYIHYDALDKQVTRTVVVLSKEEAEEAESPESSLTLELIGDEVITLDLGEEFKEPGFIANSLVDGDITSKVVVTNNINNKTPNVYVITYEVTDSTGVKELKTRRVIVKNTQVNVNIKTNLTSKYTNNNIILTIEVTGNNFSYIKYPSGAVSQNKISSYSITKNGKYQFLIYDKNNNYFVKEIEIKELDKTSPSGTCIINGNNNKTEFLVNATDLISGIDKYEYYGDNSFLSSGESATYLATKNYKSAYVYVYDKAGNYNKINCSIKNSRGSNGTIVDSKYDYLEMHMFASGYYDDAILIRTGAATIFIDGGRDDAKKLVIPYLQDLGIKKIDAMIGSHTDADHIEAQASVIENFQVVNSYYPVELSTCASLGYCDKASDVAKVVESSNKYKVPRLVKKAGEKLQIGDMTLYFLGPYQYTNTGKYRGNANSYIFILKYKNTTMIFPGDAETSTFSYSKLKPFADKLGISLDIDVLKYPHHGNANLDTDLLNAMTPSFILIPNYNASKFPNSSNKNKIQNTGAKIYQNATDINIVLISDGKNITVKTKQNASSYKR